MIAWFTRNGVAANLLMCSILAAGAFSLSQQIVFEVFPEFASDVVRISVSYRGATPAEVEEGLVIKIEEAIQDLTGIEEVQSTAGEGSGRVNVEVASGHDPREVLDDIKNRVDAISTFPVDSERPVYSLATRRREVIGVVVYGQLRETELRQLGERVRDELTALPGITQVDLTEIRPYEIAIELSEQALQKYGLTFDQVVAAIRRSSLDLPAGTLKTRGGEIRLRTRGQSYQGHEFEQIVVVRNPDGTQLTVGDLATVSDGFEETPIEAEFNGEPCVVLEIYRVGDQNAMDLARTVREYVDRARSTLPPGVKIAHWRDRSVIIEKRLSTLLGNAAQGAVLVLLLLGLFLRPKVALWVCMGIPVSFMGALAVMPHLGITINIMSVFAFILVLGIVVDDAIVTGENIYAHRRRGVDGLTAAIEGTREVTVPVVFGVLTTIVAFMPVLLMGGRRGKFFAQIPMIIIPVLLFSLLESKLVLPAHLKHLSRRTDGKAGPLSRVQAAIAGLLEWLTCLLYQPLLRAATRWRYFTAAVFVGMLLIIGAATLAGHIKFVYFPRVQSETARGSLAMGLGTPFDVTRRHVARMAAAARTLRDRHVDPGTGESVIKDILATTGSAGGTRGESHVGRVTFEIVPPEDRKLQITSTELVQEWRKLIGPIPGAKELNFRAEIGRRSDPIDIQLIGNDLDRMRAVASDIKTRLTTYPGVFDITDGFDEGKLEVQMRLKPEAEQLGLRVADLARQVRQGFFGAQAQRIQRGRDDLRVMVRYPYDERQSLGNLEQMQLRSPAGDELPFSMVAEARIERGLASITRIDRQRTVSVTADVDKRNADPTAINRDLAVFLDELEAAHPGLSFQMAGEARDQRESLGSLELGLLVVLLGIYGLLAIPFKSYLQPIVVMMVIPFGWAAAVVGHWIMGMDLSIFSILGMLALTGVVVNDSLVLVDFINRRRLDGVTVLDAVRESGVARFRAILLTSLTTYAGLMPLIYEKSTQAQFLIPMAVSLGFGVLLSTFVTLLLVPVGYLMLEDGIRIGRTLKAALWDLDD